jgi:hypothetical protein
MPSRLKVCCLIAIFWLAASWMFVWIAPALGAADAPGADPFSGRSVGGAPAGRTARKPSRKLKISLPSKSLPATRPRMVMIFADDAEYCGLATVCDAGECVYIFVPGELERRVLP